MSSIQLSYQNVEAAVATAKAKDEQSLQKLQQTNELLADTITRQKEHIEQLYSDMHVLVQYKARHNQFKTIVTTELLTNGKIDAFIDRVESESQPAVKKYTDRLAKRKQEFTDLTHAGQDPTPVDTTNSKNDKPAKKQRKADPGPSAESDDDDEEAKAAEAAANAEYVAARQAEAAAAKSKAAAKPNPKPKDKASVAPKPPKTDAAKGKTPAAAATPKAPPLPPPPRRPTTKIRSE